MQILFSETGFPMYKPFANAAPLSTVIVFDQTELLIVEALLTSLIRYYNEDQIDDFYYQLRAVRENVRANMPKVTQ